MNTQLENQIRETMHKAFWDLIKQDLESCPQKFDHILQLIEEIKNKIKALTPNRKDFSDELDENIDIDFLKHLFENKGFDPQTFYNLVLFLIKKVEMYAAPYLDNDIKKWKDDTIKTFENTIEFAEFLKTFFTKLHHFIDTIQNDINSFKAQFIAHV